MEAMKKFAEHLPSLRQRTPIYLDLGVFAGGVTDAQEYGNSIEYITISSVGNASAFGDLSVGRGYSPGGASNGINDRGVIGGGYSGGNSNVIDYISISSPSNAQDFGDLTEARHRTEATSNSTNNRSVFIAGYNNSFADCNTIDYITTNTLSNAQDFGDVSIVCDYVCATSNGVNNRGVVSNLGPNYYNMIEYFTITSVSNTIDFGDLTAGRVVGSAASNSASNRGVFGGGFNGSGNRNIVDYITIITLSNAVDFGDLTVERHRLGAVSNGGGQRAVFGGGWDDGSANTNYLDYITINTLSNAQDYGDLIEDRAYPATCSDL